ncbi:unnamed protein product [Psylliodes chrysocephalus]|uniref:CCDC174 alpha/beta GRSR domain-containing protein n=1 Tax=Psylliodes chrysocephalus TaxID=3402493 RepID=A0A9P0CTD4_9CUCU|nr:unnamed protein product [Psylliodes chrysocephala]
MSTYEISKSSLLSLKAEILRKQQELSKAKLENEVKKKVLKNNPLDIKNKGIELREKNDQTDEHEDLLKQSRSVLERKARLYDKLSSGKQSAENEEISKNYLVRFDKKRPPIEDLAPDHTESHKNSSESDDNYYESDGENDKDPSQKWVDYVDCFGRTKMCMQKDLEFLKSKDKELGGTIEEKEQNPNLEASYKDDDFGLKEKTEPTKSTASPNEESELLSSDMRRELLRQQWEREEEELCNKTDIHYQDILFGEARSHGVGYYGFSKDEEERSKQQEALRKLREETKLKQKKAQELRNSREKLLAARLKAARNRKRARMGLPPEEDEPTPSLPIPEEKEIEVEEVSDKDRLLLEARKNHIRPWDIGKEGVKEHQIMTQEEWVEQKRADRQKEFAPPTNYRKDFRANIKQTDREDTEVDKTLTFTTKKASNSRWKFERNTINDEFNYSKSSTYFEEIHQSPNIQQTPIKDLDTGLDFDDTLLEEYNKIIGNSNKIGVEIAPPPTYDYYGPSQNKIRKHEAKQTNIHDSIEAGLKFLRKQVEEKEKSTKHPDDIFLF